MKGNKNAREIKTITKNIETTRFYPRNPKLGETS
jgi:hypothetical protein